MALAFTSSIRQRTVLGFLLVVMPLMLALVSTIVLVEKLALKMESTLEDAIKAVEASRLLTNQVLSMERNAEQYVVLQEPELLDRYIAQRKLLTENVSSFSELELPGELDEQLFNLVEQENNLFTELESWVFQKTQEPGLVWDQPGSSLVSIVSPIPQAVMGMVSRNSEKMQQRIERVHGLLMWQVIALVPMTILVAVVFSVLITRPLKQITSAVKDLGEGDLQTAVIVKGPEDVRKLGEQLDWMRLKLAEIDSQKQDFLQHVSHELKTPLTTIREGSELLRDEVVGSLSDEQKEVVTIIQENSLQLQSQVEGLLDFNQALLTETIRHVSEVDIGEVVKEIVDRHQLNLRARNIKIESRLSKIMVQGVKEQLNTVVDNILSNAIKYAPDDSIVKVELNQNNEHITLDVIDEGVGVEMAERVNIFKPFYQGKQLPAGPVKGTGLGLSIAERYIAIHQGHIEIIESKSGAHFRVQLPLVCAET